MHHTPCYQAGICILCHLTLIPTLGDCQIAQLIYIQLLPRPSFHIKATRHHYFYALQLLAVQTQGNWDLVT